MNNDSMTIDPNAYDTDGAQVGTQTRKTCKNCGRETHPAYLERYGGYCLDCDNAGVPEKDAKIAEMNERLMVIARERDSARAVVRMLNEISDSHEEQIEDLRSEQADWKDAVAYATMGKMITETALAEMRERAEKAEQDAKMWQQQAMNHQEIVESRVSELRALKSDAEEHRARYQQRAENENGHSEYWSGRRDEAEYFCRALAPTEPSHE